MSTHVNESCPRSVRYDPMLLATQMQELDPQLSPILHVEESLHDGWAWIGVSGLTSGRSDISAWLQPVYKVSVEKEN